MRLHNENRSIRIAGDGVAVGNNNHITVIKESDRQRGRPDADGAGQAASAGILAAAIAAVLYGVHAFARHADAIYQSLGVLAMADWVFAAGVCWYWWRNEAWGQVMKCLVLVALAGIAAAGLAGAYEYYPKELIALSAQSAGGRAFICGLSAYARQVAMTHAVTASAGFGAGLLLLLAVTCSDGMRLWRGDWWPGASQIGSWACVSVAAGLILISTWVHAGPAPATALDLPAPLSMLICGVVR
jgi:hypothetical protein